MRREKRQKRKMGGNNRLVRIKPGVRNFISVSYKFGRFPDIVASFVAFPRKLGQDYSSWDISGHPFGIPDPPVGTPSAMSQLWPSVYHLARLPKRSYQKNC